MRRWMAVTEGSTARRFFAGGRDRREFRRFTRRRWIQCTPHVRAGRRAALRSRSAGLRRDLRLRRLFRMAAEGVAHGREHLVGEDRLAPRLNREKSAAVRTGAGTPSSIAALIVQRPSPESDTRPLKSGDRGRRAAPSPSGREATELITLPRAPHLRHSGRSSRTGTAPGCAAEWSRRRCHVAAWPTSACRGCSGPRRTRPSRRTRCRCGPSSRSGRHRWVHSGGSPARRCCGRLPDRPCARSRQHRRATWRIRRDRRMPLLTADHQRVAPLEPPDATADAQST